MASPEEVSKKSRGTRRGPATREAIFEAALRSFRKRGFHATSIKDIGAASGVSGPAIYRHFASKGEVLAEAIREGSRRIVAATRDALEDESLSPEDALEELIRAYVGVALDNADIYLAYVLESRHLADEFRKPLRRSELKQRDAWHRLVQAVHPEMANDEVRTMVTMAIFSVASLCFEPSRLEREELVEFATSRVMATLIAASPTNAST
jgi:AcrR family transcriptional regulator